MAKKSERALRNKIAEEVEAMSQPGDECETCRMIRQIAAFIRGEGEPLGVEIVEADQ